MTNEEMCIAIQNGDKSHILELWQSVKYLCFAIAGRYYQRYQARFAACGVELEDYRQESFLAFMQAVKAYKPDADYKFATYLNFPIKNKGAELAGLRGADKPLNGAVSLYNEILTDDKPIPLIDTIEDGSALERFEKVLDDIECVYTREVLKNAIKQLDDKKQMAITLYYFHNLPLDVIGKALGISGKGVDWQRKKALRLMRCMPELVMLSKELAIDKRLNKQHNPCSENYIRKQSLASAILRRGGDYFTDETKADIYESCYIERKAIENPEFILWDSLSSS